MIAAIVPLGCTWDFHMKQDTPSLPMWRMWEHIFLWRITSDDDIVWIEVPYIKPPGLRRFAPGLRSARCARFALGVALRGFTYQNYYCNRFVSNCANLILKKTRGEKKKKHEGLVSDLDNFILKFVRMCRKVSEVPPGYLLLVSFKIVRLATVLNRNI